MDPGQGQAAVATAQPKMTCSATERQPQPWKLPEMGLRNTFKNHYLELICKNVVIHICICINFVEHTAQYTVYDKCCEGRNSITISNFLSFHVLIHNLKPTFQTYSLRPKTPWRLF